MDPVAARRIGLLTQHLTCEPSPDSHAALERASTGASPPSNAGNSGGSSSSAGAPGSSYASATGRPTSYARVHGEVSRAPAVWRRIDTVQKEQLQEVKYEKSVGEGIAKVRPALEAVAA